MAKNSVDIAKLRPGAVRLFVPPLVDYGAGPRVEVWDGQGWLFLQGVTAVEIKIRGGSDPVIPDMKVTVSGQIMEIFGAEGRVALDLLQALGRQDQDQDQAGIEAEPRA